MLQTQEMRIDHQITQVAGNGEFHGNPSTNYANFRRGGQNNSFNGGRGQQTFTGRGSQNNRGRGGRGRGGNKTICQICVVVLVMLQSSVITGLI